MSKAGTRLTLEKRSVCFLLFLGLITPARAESCSFGTWFDFKGTKIYRNASKTAYVYTTSHSRIDADGAPNAYHPEDVGKNCTKDPHRGLDCPANAGYPNTSWWNQVLIPDPGNPSRAFVQQSGPFKGFFVAATWLTDASKRTTDPARYVDATKVPYVVFPGSSFGSKSGTGFKGDVGFAWHLDNGKSTAFIVADQGGGEDAKLGEGSIALYEALGGQDVNPRTGSGVAKGKVRFVVFPGSRKAAEPVWPRTQESIDQQARKLLDQIGGEEAIKGCE
ncbi:MAG TPA: glycoside hydrolase family 75 protein [Beijerinckiaceae bacterium]|jgi:hypothetical protein